MRKIREIKFPGTAVQEPGAYEQSHRELARKAASEGMVLLKNEHQVLPLARKSRIALYGAGVSKTIKGGTGSGDVNERESVSIYQGMKDAGYQIVNEEWIAAYDQIYQEARLAWREEIYHKMKQNDLDFFTAYSTTPFYLPTGLNITKTDSDTAIYVISRIAGENADRFFKEGDYQLSREEKKELNDICSLYSQVIVVVNAGGLVDLSFMDQYTNIFGLIYIVQPGMEGGHAFADMVCGEVTPSGKLTDTWALSYMDYPNSATFSHNNGNVSEERYEEGIYMGYRYFDSFDVPVRFGFGFGLSYTPFGIKTEEISFDSVQKEIQVKVCADNQGKTCRGKEVVQIYVSLPEGKLEKEYRRLCGFAKTKELLPGESQTLTISFPVYQMASFDSQNAEWILEEGYYGIWVGNSLASSELTGMLHVEEKAVLEKTESICPLQTELKELSLSPEKRLARYERWVKEGREKGLSVLSLEKAALSIKKEIDKTRKEKRKQLEEEAEKLADRLSTEQLIQLACGASNMNTGSNLGAAGTAVPGSAGETSSCAKNEGIAAITLADGPAGLRLNQQYFVKEGQIVPLPFEASIEKGFFWENTLSAKEGSTPYFQYCTAIPVGTLLAQTWNIKLLEQIGEMIGEEMQRFDVTLWLAPGMNLHRNPLCGRNFEYYSEDPLISGKMAAAITRGVQKKKGCGTTIKHFACNNQEDNRMYSNSVLSERTFRELYAKGFELAVKESQPMSIMTSYNFINGIHAANHYDLCTKLARKEWGFEGVIMTDWTTTEHDESCTAAGCMRAGNDLIMPGHQKDYENLRRELEAGSLSVQEIKDCVKRLIIVILQSNRYEEQQEN